MSATAGCLLIYARVWKEGPRNAAAKRYQARPTFAEATAHLCLERLLLLRLYAESSVHALQRALEVRDPLAILGRHL